LLLNCGHRPPNSWHRGPPAHSLKRSGVTVSCVQAACEREGALSRPARRLTAVHDGTVPRRASRHGRFAGPPAAGDEGIVIRHREAGRRPRKKRAHDQHQGTIGAGEGGRSTAPRRGTATSSTWRWAKRFFIPGPVKAAGFVQNVSAGQGDCLGPGEFVDGRRGWTEGVAPPKRNSGSGPASGNGKDGPRLSAQLDTDLPNDEDQDFSGQGCSDGPGDDKRVERKRSAVSAQGLCRLGNKSPSPLAREDQVFEAENSSINVGV